MRNGGPVSFGFNKLFTQFGALSMRSRENGTGAEKMMFIFIFSVDVKTKRKLCFSFTFHSCFGQPVNTNSIQKPGLGKRDNFKTVNRIDRKNTLEKSIKIDSTILRREKDLKKSTKTNKVEKALFFISD